MRAFKLEVELGNEACLAPEDVAYLLRQVADRLEELGANVTPGVRSIQDANGNTVGEWYWPGGES